MYVRHICHKNVINRIMTIFEERIFRELLEILKVSRKKYTLEDFKENKHKSLFISILWDSFGDKVVSKA
jgi:hypothetical protein